MRLGSRIAWFLGLGISFASVVPGALAADASPSPTKPVAAEDVAVDDKTSLVIRGALKYLAGHQGASGSFSPNEQQVAYTGYALMAFMASGELPGEGEYGKPVSAGMHYLLNSVHPDGFIDARTGGGNMYGHGIATIALAEMYGQTQDDSIRPRLELAARLIIDCQGIAGGWRYAPKVNSDADMSVTVLQVVALRAARNAGVEVPQQTFDKAIEFVKSCHVGADGGFSYQPHQASGFARTAAAIYSLQVCGMYDDPYITPASNYLTSNFNKPATWFSYGNFYAAPAQYMVGGEVWIKWYHLVHDKLMNTVKSLPDGSCYWEPMPNESPRSPLYCTSVAATILAMPYHYIPLYQR
jgi:hypothetical protein